MSATESPEELLERLAAARDLPQVKRPELYPVAITGSRKRGPTREEMTAFWSLFDRLGGTELHHGDAWGIDRGVEREAKRERPNLKIVPHPADWKTYGKPAGPIRNEEMLAQCRALIAFPGNVGTGRCTESARRMDRPVYLISDEIDRRRNCLEQELLGRVYAQDAAKGLDNLAPDG